MNCERAVIGAMFEPEGGRGEGRRAEGVRYPSHHQIFLPPSYRRDTQHARERPGMRSECQGILGTLR
jgi:hypothetical protein